MNATNTDEQLQRRVKAAQVYARMAEGGWAEFIALIKESARFYVDLEEIEEQRLVIDYGQTLTEIAEAMGWTAVGDHGGDVGVNAFRFAAAHGWPAVLRAVALAMEDQPHAPD